MLPKVLLSMLLLGAPCMSLLRQASMRHPRTSLCYKNDEMKEPGPSSPPKSMSIPVLGPIPGRPPLMIGSEVTLTPPTPMQWYSIEEAVHQHAIHQDNEANKPGISAAPLVAIIDDYTKDGNIKKRYATLAAIVSRKRPTSTDDDDMPYGQGIEDHVTFLGIGRAMLSDFRYQVPADFYDSQVDDDGYLIEEETNDAPKFVVATVQRLGDEEPEFSPIHAINRMSQIANQLRQVHEDRRKLVAGLAAAKARLQFAGVEELEDYDGLGMLSSSDQVEERESTQDAIDFILNDYGTEVFTSTRDSSRLHELENYGLGFSSSAVCSIPQLARMLMRKLAAYYSPETRSKEEHFFEILSYVCMHSMEHVLEPQDLSFALKTTSTIKRLETALELMWLHARDLKREAEKASKELRDCGEECTDLW